MESKLSIGAFAKLAGTTTETLRHYDKMGLLKPALVDEETNYRYYVLAQAERLFAILEFRQLGMTLEEIKDYFEGGADRTIEDSIALLEKQAALLEDRIRDLKTMQGTVGEKLKYLKQCQKYSVHSAVSYKYIGERPVFGYDDTPVGEDKRYFTEAIPLEGKINTIPPKFATTNYGAILWSPNEITLFTTTAGPTHTGKSLGSFSAALFICCYYYGDAVDEFCNVAQKLCETALEDGYEPLGPPLAICQIDKSVTENRDDLLYEVQIPVQKKENVFDV